MKTLLIIDDERPFLTLYKREFAEEGYDVLTAENATSGLKLAKDRRPDCVVVDIRLPDMDGLTLMQSILAHTPDVPIVINSAFHDAKDEFLSWCAKAYVVKSSDLDELKKAVATVTRPRAMTA